MARRYRLVHDPVLVRYLMENYPFNTYQINVRLGMIRKGFLKGIPAKYSKVAEICKHIADAVVILPEKVIIIECVVRSGDWDKALKIDIYEDDFKKTERFKQHWDKPIEKILLTTVTDPYMKSVAAKRGIKVVQYRPKGIEYYLGTLQKRQVRPKGSALE